MFKIDDQVEYLEGDRWLPGKISGVFRNSVTIVPYTHFQQAITRPLNQVRRINGT